MRIIDIALNDLLQILRDWKAAVFLLAMPIGFTLLFGFIFSQPSNPAEENTRLPVVVASQSMSPLEEPFSTLLSLSETARPISPEEGQDFTDLKKQVEDEEIAAVVLVPQVGQDSLLTGDIPNFEVIINTESNAGSTVQWAIQGSITRLKTAATTAQFSTRTRAEFRLFENQQAEIAYYLESLDAAVQAWETPPLRMESTYTGQDVNKPEEVENPFTHSSPGMMVQFAIAGLIGSAEILVLERKSGSLRRLMTAPIRRYDILLGHFLSMVIMSLVQLTLLIVFAQVFLDVPYFSAPFATFLVALSTAIFTGAMGLLIGILSKTPEQVVVFSLLPMFVLSGLGGAWLPLELTGEAFQRVAYFTPTAWSVTAFKNIIQRGQGLESVLVPVGVILAFAIATFSIAAWRFRYQEA